MVAPTPSGYSARVEIELLAGGRRFSPGQIGGGMLKFDGETVLPGTSGELILHIDEHVRRWLVTWEASGTPRRTIMAEFRDLDDAPLPDHTTPA